MSNRLCTDAFVTVYTMSTGAVEAPFRTFIKQCTKILIITAFCITANSYTATFVPAIQGLETDFADIMSTPNAQATSIYQVLVTWRKKGLTCLTTCSAKSQSANSTS